MIELGVEGPVIEAMRLTPESVVWIVGAFKGKTIDFLQERFDPYIMVFDPQVHAIEHLRLAAERNPKVTVVEAGLSAWTCRQKMYAAGSDACTTYRALTDRPDDETECGTFVDVAELFDGPPMVIYNIDLAILNCEGGEFKIIPRLVEIGELDAFARLLVQFHSAAAPAHIYRETLRMLDKDHRPTWYEELPSWGLWVREKPSKRTKAAKAGLGLGQ